MADGALKNDIYIGSVAQPLYHYTNRSLELGSANGQFAVDVIGNELSIDTFSFTIRFQFDSTLIYAPLGKDGYLDTNDKLYRLKESGVKQYVDFVPKNSTGLVDINDDQFRAFAGYTAGDYLKDIPYGTPVFWHVSNAFFAKGYLKSIDRIGKYSWKITCVSGVGLLDTKMHGGGIYTGQTLLSIAQSIIGSTFAFTSASAVSSIKVYGHLPYDTARNNLHRLLFSAGAALTRGTASNDYVIRFLPNATVNVSDSRIAIGGTVNNELPTNRVEVTEHAFAQLPSDVAEVLYDNTTTVSADNTLVVFDKPVYGLATTGTLTIAESGVNYAVLNGTGTLTGKPYTHNQTVITLQNASPDGQIRVKRVTDNELVSAVNSRNVARRVLGYYGNAKTIKARILLQNEKAGNNLSMFNPYGEATTALLEKMSVLVTSVVGATCELVEGYEPTDNGNNYTNRVEISESGTWTVPAGVQSIRIIPIGGAQGGQGGYNGKEGLGGVRTLFDQSKPMATVYSFDDEDREISAALRYVIQSQPPQAGGSYGAGGAPGKVGVFDRDVTPGEVLTISIGVGGAGGAVGGGMGADGTPTTVSSTSIGTISSDMGTDTGYYDTIAKKQYATAGKRGYRGGAGGTSGNESDPPSGRYSGCNGGDGSSGGSVAGYAGGHGGAGTGFDPLPWPGRTMPTEFIFLANGSGGGGAAYGNAGGDGGTYTTVQDGSSVDFYSARGGDGADAIAPQKATGYGNGGIGGNGGGSGGNASGVKIEHPGFYQDYGFIHSTNAIGGAAGAGSVGGEGADGGLIILY